jgi:hypothetical protein
VLLELQASRLPSKTLTNAALKVTIDTRFNKL